MISGQLRGTNNSGAVVQGAAPNPALTQTLSLDATGGAAPAATINFTDGRLGVRWRVVSDAAIDVKLKYVDSNGDPATEAAAWRDSRDVIIFRDNITGMTFTNPTTAAVVVRVQFF
jgi:hypothetical protein